MRVLFCATDAGGGANVAPVARLLDPRDRRVFCSAASQGHFQDCGIEDAAVWTEKRSPSTELRAWNPDAVLCGTTRYASPDRAFIQAAVAQSVRAVAILDEWYRYGERFADVDGRLTALPDAIAVPDRRAVAEAEAEGLPADRLVATGSPALAGLCTRLDQFVVKPPPLPEAFAEGSGLRILFLSETHASDFGDVPGGRGPLGPFLGYSERSVADDLAHALAARERDCVVVEKLHPCDNEARPMRRLVPGQTWRSQGQVALQPLLWHADVVIGMRSMAMLEGALAGKPVLSYQPGLTPGHTPVTGVRLGMVDTASSITELARWLGAHWFSKPKLPISRPVFATTHAAANVRSVLAGVSLVQVVGG